MSNQLIQLTDFVSKLCTLGSCMSLPSESPSQVNPEVFDVVGLRNGFANHLDQWACFFTSGKSDTSRLLLINLSPLGQSVASFRACCRCAVAQQQSPGQRRV